MGPDDCLRSCDSAIKDGLALLPPSRDLFPRPLVACDEAP